MVGRASRSRLGRSGGWPRTSRIARGRSGPAVRLGIVAQRRQPARAGQRDDRRRRPLAEAAQVLAEPRLDRARRAALEPLDEAADQPEGVLEGEPRVALAELGRRSLAGRAPTRRAAPRPGPDPSPGGWRAGRRGRTRGGAPPGPAPPAGRPRSARGWRRGRPAGGPVCRSSSSSGSVSAPSISGNRLRSVARIASAPTSAVARRRSSASSGAWRCSDPPRWSRQTVQR